MQETCPNLATCKWAQRRQTIIVKCSNFGNWESCKPQDVVVEPADVRVMEGPKAGRPGNIEK